MCLSGLDWLATRNVALLLYKCIVAYFHWHYIMTVRIYVPVYGRTSELNVARKHYPTKLRRFAAKKVESFEDDTKTNIFRM